MVCIQFMFPVTSQKNSSAPSKKYKPNLRSDIANKTKYKGHITFSIKTLEEIKFPLKSLKNLSFGIDLELWLPPLMDKIKAHNTGGVRRS